MKPATQEIRIVHCVGPVGDGPCPECGSKEVTERGSWDWGPFYWECEDCDFTWGES